MLAILAAATAERSVAGTFDEIVDTLADENDTCTHPGGCSLREALAATSNDDVIGFSVTGTITLTWGALSLDHRVVIVGPGADLLTVNGAGASRILTVQGGLTVTMSGVTLSSGAATAGSPDGGAIHNSGVLTLHQVTLDGNRAHDPASGPGGRGGAIYNAGELRITDSTLSGNRSGHGEGALTDGGDGGAIYNADGAFLLVSRSLLVGNHSGNEGGVPNQHGSNGDGGALFNAGTATLVNVTLSGNVTGVQPGTPDPQSGQGGAIFAAGSGGASLRLYQVTVSGNVAASGGGLARSGGEVVLSGSVLAGNGAAADPDCTGSLTSAGHNLVGIATACAGDLTGPGDLWGTPADPVDSLLGPLAPNGGLTATHALDLGSPAIDLGDPAGCTWHDPDSGLDVPLLEDQRSAPRPLDGDGDGAARCDSGAFERRGAWQVTKQDDTMDRACTPADCSLREAVRAANLAPGADIVRVPVGIYTLTLVGENEDLAATGDLDVLGDLVVLGGAATDTIIDGEDHDRVFDVLGMAALTLVDLTVKRGWAPPSDGIPTHGGGIRVSGGKLALFRCAVETNVSSGDGGGVWIQGGGLYIALSTFSENVSGGDGGALWTAVDGGSLRNSTLSTNSALGLGAGVFFADSLVQVPTGSELLNVTLAFGQASQGGALFADAPVRLERTLLSGDCAVGSGVLTTSGGNLESPGSTCGLGGGDQDGILDPLIGPLAYNGGKTATHALLAGSPAIDTAAAGSCPPTDQRGAPRPEDGDGNGTAICDVGAYERSQPPSHLLTVTLDGTGAGTVTSSPLGIACAPVCSGSFTEGTLVTLTATPVVLSVFHGWSGDCTGTGPCQLVMTEDLEVSASFLPQAIFSDGFESGDTSAWSPP